MSIEKIVHDERHKAQWIAKAKNLLWKFFKEITSK